jgi:hypothetical protein
MAETFDKNGSGSVAVRGWLSLVNAYAVAGMAPGERRTMI